jgi:hypothetical protein
VQRDALRSSRNAAARAREETRVEAPRQIRSIHFAENDPADRMIYAANVFSSREQSNRIQSELLWIGLLPRTATMGAESLATTQNWTAC